MGFIESVGVNVGKDVIVGLTSVGVTVGVTEGIQVGRLEGRLEGE